MANVFGPAAAIVLLLYLAFLILTIVASVKILSKAGYSGWWILIAIVPVVNVIMFFVFAFSEWPVLRRQSAASRDRTWS